MAILESCKVGRIEGPGDRPHYYIHITFHTPDGNTHRLCISDQSALVNQLKLRKNVPILPYLYGREKYQELATFVLNNLKSIVAVEYDEPSKHIITLIQTSVNSDDGKFRRR